jgi:hypothetical protein
MTEADHLPAGLDDGIDPTIFDGLWFEQVIQQSAKPRIVGLRVHPIPLANGNTAIVLTIPPSLTAHQASDGRYYRRRNLRIDIMEDYEIREAMHRSFIPRLRVSIALSHGRRGALTYRANEEISEPFTVYFSIENEAETPALYTLFTIGLDDKLVMRSYGALTAVAHAADTDKKRFVWYQRRYAVPTDLPIFKEASYTVPDAVVQVCGLATDFAQYSVRTRIQTPGFSLTQNWIIQQVGFSLEILADEPEHPS